MSRAGHNAFERGGGIDCNQLQSTAADCSREGRWPGRSLQRDCRGSVLMESVLVFPFLLFLITAIFQLARFWQARLYTQYAAYNAARAVLVHNPKDYMTGGKFRERGGVAWLAALNTLAWIGDGDGSGPNFEMDGYGSVPASTDVARRVRIVPEASSEENGWVQVTVEYRYPTIFAVHDPAKTWPDGRPGATEDRVAQLSDTGRFPYFTFKESCLLPKPWSTTTFPGISPDEWLQLMSGIGGGS